MGSGPLRISPVSPSGAVAQLREQTILCLRALPAYLARRQKCLTFHFAQGEHTLDRAAKKQCVASLADVFDSASVVVVAHYSGLNVAQMQALRKQMRAAGATVRVAKNRLVKIALQGKPAAPISALMRGPTLVAYSDDPVAAPKAAVAFAKENDKLVILGGVLGTVTLNVDGVRSLATLPSLDELRATLIGLIKAPASKLAQISAAPASKLARVFAAYAGKTG